MTMVVWPTIHRHNFSGRRDGRSGRHDHQQQTTRSSILAGQHAFKSSNILPFSNRRVAGVIKLKLKAGEQTTTVRGALPLSYAGIIPAAGFEPATSRLRGEVTVVFTTGRNISCCANTSTRTLRTNSVHENGQGTCGHGWFCNWRIRTSSPFGLRSIRVLHH